MAGKSFNNSFYFKDRAMHPGSVLGFHAPVVQAQGGTFDAADLDDAYSRAIEQVGKKLLSVARYRDESWSNPLVKPGLINEMMMRRGDNFFFIDTVARAAEYEIDLIAADGPPALTGDGMRNACKHAIAAATESSVMEEAVEYWLKGTPTKQEPKDGTGPSYIFLLNRHKGRFCEVRPPGELTELEKSAGIEPSTYVTIGVGGEGAGGEREMQIPDWFFWESDKKLSSLPHK